MAPVDRILHEKRGMLLSFDQGLEEGPKVFNLHSIDPNYVLNIALEGEYTGLVLHPGIAEKYITEQYREIPIVMKLNAKSAMQDINPLSRQTCTVERAIKLGAQAVGYSIYDGTPAESTMFAEFGTVLEQAHDYGIPVIAWMYSKQDASDTDSSAYAARIALELGADAVKLKYNGDRKGFEWVNRAAGQCKVLVADQDFTSELQVLQHVHEAVLAGASGVALGKTIWQHPKPFSLSRAVHAILFKGKTPQEAMKYLG